MRIKEVDLEIEPLTLPSKVRVKGSNSTLPLNVLTPGDLAKIVSVFKREVFKLAEKVPPPEAVATPENDVKISKLEDFLYDYNRDQMSQAEFLEAVLKTLQMKS